MKNKSMMLSLVLAMSLAFAVACGDDDAQEGARDDRGAAAGANDQTLCPDRPCPQGFACSERMTCVRAEPGAGNDDGGGGAMPPAECPQGEVRSELNGCVPAAVNDTCPPGFWLDGYGLGQCYRECPSDQIPDERNECADAEQCCTDAPPAWCGDKTGCAPETPTDYITPCQSDDDCHADYYCNPLPRDFRLCREGRRCGESELRSERNGCVPAAVNGQCSEGYRLDGYNRGECYRACPDGELPDDRNACADAAQCCEEDPPAWCPLMRNCGIPPGDNSRNQ